MGAESFVAYYGVKFDIQDPAEMDMLSATTAMDIRTRLNLKSIDPSLCHPRVIAAVDAGLDWWWGLDQEEGYSLIIGKELGKLGWENRAEVVVYTPELETLMAETRERLVNVGLNEPAGLHLHHEPDF